MFYFCAPYCNDGDAALLGERLAAGPGFFSQTGEQQMLTGPSANRRL